jgi:CrcB protein
MGRWVKPRSPGSNEACGSIAAMRTVWVGVAGFAGAVARYSLGGWIARHNRGAFPWETFAINVTGSFLLGLLFALFTDRFRVDPTLRVAMTVGFLGAYTTFSTFAFETMRLAEDGAIALAAGNVAASAAAGLAAVYAGTWIGRSL